MIAGLEEISDGTITIGDRICVMYDGKIQQIAPPMNFLTGKISSKNGEIVFVLNDGYILEIKTTNGQFKPYIDKEMVLGVRPEHLTVEPLAGHSNNEIKSNVNIVETLGDRKDVYLTSTAGQKFIANLDPHST
jgi:multiple sugar transport system ATP-binding protein